MSRMPDRGPRPNLDRHRRWRPSNSLIAAIALLIVIVGPYLAFTKHIPFTGYGYELNAVFRDSDNISLNSPVRIAGVNVGKVIGVSRDGNASKVTFTVDGSGRPVTADAYAQIRPRIFLEGNFFIDLHPGSPTAPELDSGATIPISHTSTSVQLDQVLSALQSPVRANLAKALEGYGTALTHTPTPAENATQDPLVQGVTGAGGLNLALQYGGPAGRGTAQVSNAFLGTAPHDLSRLIASAGRTFNALGGRERKLEELITNWNTFTGALAAQSSNLSDTVRELAPALTTARTSLANLNLALPPLRTWARAFRPAVAELPATIRAGEPWLQQILPLESGREAGGLAKLLARIGPGYGEVTEAGLDTLTQSQLLSLCTSHVLVPTGNQVINDQFSTGQPNYREFFYSTVDLAGEGQNFTGNGPYLSLLAGTGSTLASTPSPSGSPQNPRNPSSLPDRVQYAHVIAPPLGSQPPVKADRTTYDKGGNPSGKIDNTPQKNGKATCFKQPVPDLNAGSLGAPMPAVP